MVVHVPETLSRRAEDRSQTTKFVQTPRQRVFLIRITGRAGSWFAGINHDVSEPEMPPINFVGASTYFSSTGFHWGHGTSRGFSIKYLGGRKVPVRASHCIALT